MTSPLVKPTVTLAALSSACRPQILSWDGRLEYEIGVTLQGTVDNGDDAPQLGHED